MMNSITSTNESSWGFWGTMKEDASTAWPLAISAVAEATGEEGESVRIFLDSRHGRHFADDVHNHMVKGLALNDAILATTRQWMDWKIDRNVSKDFGIPQGLPYLTGFVVHSVFLSEESAT